MKSTPVLERRSGDRSRPLLPPACGLPSGAGDFLRRQHEFLDQSPRSIGEGVVRRHANVTSLRVLGSVDTDEYGMA